VGFNHSRQKGYLVTEKDGTSKFPYIGAPALSALEHAGYTNLDDLTYLTEAHVANLHGMGPKAMGILRETLAERGQSFAPEAFPKLSSPARRALEQAGYTRLEDLARASETDIADLHGMGPKAMETLRELLAERGLTFAHEG
jgi:DNA-directed RNA polymerase alpha subunit